MNDLVTISAGDVVEIFEQRRLMTAFCLGYRKNRLNLITETSKILNVSPTRIIHNSKKRMDPNTNRGIIISFLRDVSDLRNRIADGIDLEALWNHQESKGMFIELQVLKDQIRCPVETESEDDCLAGILRAFSYKKCYFKHVDKKVYVFTEDEVQSTLEQMRAAQKEKELIDELSEWMERKLGGFTLSDALPQGYNRFINALKAIAVKDTDNQDTVFTNAVLNRISLPPGTSAFDILVRLGEFHPDENLDFLKLKYATHFSEQALEEIDHLKQTSAISGEHRRNLEDLNCITIDGPQTNDFDDAISCVPITEGRYEIGIHITDVSNRIHPGSFLDAEACERGQTLYLPNKTWHMFPPVFSESIASLKENVRQPAISIVITFSADFELEKVDVFPSIIRVKKRWTYDEVDNEIESVPFTILLQAAEKLKQKRIENGAVIIPRPEIIIDAQDSQKIVIHRRNRQSKSQLIVSEMMILANSTVADYAARSDLPFPYRIQVEPDEPLPRSDDVFNPYISYCQRRVMPRAEPSLVPRPHFSLGLTTYTNITSPLRRYFDVLAQRQLKALLGLESPYTYEELDFIMNDLEVSVTKAATISYRQNRYWLLKYLSGLRGQSIPAIVLDRYSTGYQIWLQDLCLDADLPLSFGHKLYPEQPISVIIEKVSAREDILKLRLKD